MLVIWSVHMCTYVGLSVKDFLHQIKSFALPLDVDCSFETDIARHLKISWDWTRTSSLIKCNEKIKLKLSNNIVDNFVLLQEYALKCTETIKMEGK